MNSKIWLHATLLCAGLFLAVSPALAQPAGALGKPLPASDLETGTVSVRVVDGLPSKPEVGINVELVGQDGKSRNARTDAQGRATFPRLEPGRRYRAKVTIRNEEDATQGATVKQSDELTVPSEGGVRLMLSTSAWKGPAAAGGAGPAMAGMPDPRRMSGIARGEPNDPAGTLTVRVVAGTMAANVPNQLVNLVGYNTDGTVTRISRPTDGSGRVQFTNLHIGTTAYYVSSWVTRKRGGRTMSDRLQSNVITMPPQVGVRLLLSGEPADSGAAPTEGLDRYQQQNPRQPAGEVVVGLYGETTGVREIELHRIDDKGSTAIARAPVQPSVPSGVRGQMMPAAEQDGLAQGSLVVIVGRPGQGQSQSIQPIKDASITLTPLSDDSAPAQTDEAASAQAQTEAQAEATTTAQTMATQTTGDQGLTVFTNLVPGQRYRPMATVHGVTITGKPFVMSATTGMHVAVQVSWDSISQYEARFTDVASGPDQVFLARVVSGDRPFSSAPFQTVPDRGAETRVLVLASLEHPVSVQFQTQGVVDDVYMGYQTQFTVRNWSFFPVDTGDDGFSLPLPAGFVGAQVDDEMMSRVIINPGEGLTWRGAIPPGGEEFRTWYSLPVKDGRVNFDMPLPYGAQNSMLIIEKTKGMKIEGLPESTRQRPWKDPNGRDYALISGIQIKPMQRMVMSVSGLPQKSAWETIVPALVGGIVLLILAWGAWGTFVQSRRDRQAAANANQSSSSGDGRRRKLRRQREHLLDELVNLEARKADIDDREYDRRRQKLTKQLEAVYLELEKQSAGPPPSSAS